MEEKGDEREVGCKFIASLTQEPRNFVTEINVPCINNEELTTI